MALAACGLASLALALDPASPAEAGCGSRWPIPGARPSAARRVCARIPNSDSRGPSGQISSLRFGSSRGRPTPLRRPKVAHFLQPNSRCQPNTVSGSTSPPKAGGETMRWKAAMISRSATGAILSSAAPQACSQPRTNKCAPHAHRYRGLWLMTS